MSKISLDPKYIDSPRLLVADRALEYAKSNLRKINVVPGIFMGNQKCYQNTRDVLDRQPKGSVMVACIAFIPDGRGANLHFLNKPDNKKAEYVDSTLGYQAKQIEYYLIDEYTIEDLDKLNGEWKIYPKIIDDLQDKFLNMWFTEDERKLMKISREHF